MIIWNYYRFHENDRLSKENFDKMRLSLSEVEKQMFFDELDSNQNDCKLEPHEFFWESNVIPLAKDVVLPDPDFHGSNEIIHTILHLELVV